MYLVFDLGGTKLRVATSIDGKQLSPVEFFPSPSSYEAGLAIFRELALRFYGKERISAVAGGLAGSFERGGDRLITAGNIKDWTGKPIYADLRKIFRAQVFLHNDAALAGLGEAHLGAGRGAPIVAYFTLSTGFGGARITRGEIDESAFGFEPSFQIVDVGGAMCGVCRKNKSIRIVSHISGNGILRHAGKKGEYIRDKRFWDDKAKYLALALNNSLVFWSPDVIVLGGSVMKSIPMNKVCMHLKNFAGKFMELPLSKKSGIGSFSTFLKKAELGERSALLGALIYLRQELKNGKARG